MKRILKFFISVLLLPFAVGFVQSFYAQLLSIGKLSRQHYYFIFGFLLYLLVQFCLFKPIRTYVFGHELTHILWSLLFGGRVKSFKISKTGGRVLLTRTNFLIRLAPYFFPLYSILVLAMYYVLGLFMTVTQYHPYLLFLLGFTLSFHLALTLHALRPTQKDIQDSGGAVFSMLIVFMANLMFIIIIMKAVFPLEIGIGSFFSQGWFYSLSVFKRVIIFFSGGRFIV